MSAAVATVSVRRAEVHPLLVIAGLAVIVAAVVVISTGLGAVSIAPERVLETFFAGGTRAEQRIVYDLRLPRILVALLVGAGLACAGTILQAVTRNPLASPAVVGINGGAGLAAVMVLFLLPAAPESALSLAAAAGATIAGSTTYVLARKNGVVAPVRLALIGIAIGALCLALIQLFIIRFIILGDFQVALRWLTGSLWARSWDHVLQIAPWSLVLLPIAWLLADRLDLLLMGDDVARSLGSRVETLRGVALVAAVGLAASSVAVAGTIAFVGLIAPHLARALVGPKHRVVVPTALLLGGLLVLLADTVGRTVFAPTEVPAGLITALLGAPFFLFLLRSGARL